MHQQEIRFRGVEDGACGTQSGRRRLFVMVGAKCCGWRLTAGTEATIPSSAAAITSCGTGAGCLPEELCDRTQASMKPAFRLGADERMACRLVG